MELDFASFGVYSLAGKRHANEDRWVAFTHLHLCPNISAPAWQLKKKKKKKKKGSKGGDDGGKEEKGGKDSDQADQGGYLPLSFFAVYDGHGGSLCVETVSARLHKYIINQRTRGLFFLRDPELINEALIREAIRRGFEDMDREVIRTTEQKGDSSGSCAVAIILLYNRVFIAHAGDTRAVLGQVKGSGKGSVSEPFSPLPTRLYGAELKKTNSDSSIPGHVTQGGMMSSKSADSVTTPRRWERRMSDEDRRATERGKWTRKTLKNLRTIDLTEDHKATNEKEKKRMKLKGGFVANGRVFGVLAVARAFGDRSLKMSPQEYQIRKIKGSGSVMRRNRDADALSDEHSSSDDDDDNESEKNEKNESDNHKNESDNGGGNESGAVSTDVVASEERTAVAATAPTNGESATATERRASRRVTQQRGKELNAGLPFDNDELWGWVEAQRMPDLRAATDFEADEKARKAEKKAAKDKERAGAGAGTSSSEQGHADAGAEGGGDGASPRHENGADVGEGEGAKGGKKGRKGESYEAMTEKEMRRRQDKALKKRSKQIRKEREQLKEKERKVKEMAKIQERRGNAGEGVVVALPDIDCRTISPDDRFILIASDGLWDVCPSKESVKVVSQLYMEQQLQAAAAPVAAPAQSGVVPVPMLRKICESVCRSARKGGSSDDITCLLIALHPTII